MRNLFILAGNTLRVTFRKKSNRVVYLVLPVLVILLTMFMYNSMSSKLNIGIYNKDANGVLAKEFIQGIKDQDRYRVKMVEEKDIKKLVGDSSVDCVITIPEDFDESIYNNTFNKLEISTIKGQESTGFIQNYVNYYMNNLMSLSKVSNGDKGTFDKLYTGFKNQTLKLHINLLEDKSRDKLATVQSIGFLIMFMLQGATSTAGLILKEKQERTYYRIFSAPVNNKIYIGANILANMCIMIVQSVLVVYASKHLFKLNTGVPDLQLIAVLTIFGFVCVTVGILLVAFSATSVQVGTMATLITIPTCMLSGCFWPLELMPNFMQKIANFLPQTWALKTIQQLQDGKTFMEVMPYLGIIISFALAFFLIGMYKMKNNDSVKSFV